MMKPERRRLAAASIALVYSGSAAALAPSPTSVPVDSPWAIAGLGAVVAVAAASVLIRRRK